MELWLRHIKGAIGDSKRISHKIESACKAVGCVRGYRYLPRSTVMPGFAHIIYGTHHWRTDSISTRPRKVRNGQVEIIHGAIVVAIRIDKQVNAAAVRAGLV